MIENLHKSWSLVKLCCKSSCYWGATNGGNYKAFCLFVKSHDKCGRSSGQKCNHSEGQKNPILLWLICLMRNHWCIIQTTKLHFLSTIFWGHCAINNKHLINCQSEKMKVVMMVQIIRERTMGYYIDRDTVKLVKPYHLVSLRSQVRILSKNFFGWYNQQKTSGGC